MCPRWAAIVPADKGLIQHILSPRESSGNRRRRPSPPFPPPLILCSCLSLPLFLSPSPSLWPVTWQRPCIKGDYRTMQGASQEFEELFFKKTGIAHGRVLSYPGWTISAAAGTRNQREKARAQPEQAIFNCNSLSCLVKHYKGKKKLHSLPLCFLYLPHYEISNNVQHLPGKFTTHRMYPR